MIRMNYIKVMVAHMHTDKLHNVLDAINKRAGRNMVQAVGTGLVLVLLVVGSLVFDRQIFAWLATLFACIALWELRVDFATIGIRIPVLTLLIVTVLTLLTFYYGVEFAGIHGAQFGSIEAIILTVSAISVAVSSSVMIKSHKRVLAVAQKKIAHTGTSLHDVEQESARLTHVGASLLAFFYVTVLSSFIIIPLNWSHPVAYEFLIIFVPSLGDIGGLAFGVSFKKHHPLSPRISPKKSVEGLVGSIVFCVIGSLLIALCSFTLDELTHKWWCMVILGCAVAIVGLFGDLSASMLKRDMGLKDMGHMLRGHGGVLDRIDSVLMCAPVICLLILVFHL